MRHALRRRTGALLVLVLLAANLLAGATPASADAIADKRAEAERIARQLEQQGRQVSMLAEDYDAARVQVASVDEQLAAATSKVQATDAEAGDVRGRLKEQAVAAYMKGGSMPALAMLADTKSADDVAIRSQYVHTVTSGAFDTLDELRAVRLRLDEQQAALSTARADAKAAADLAAAKRKQAAAAQAAQEKTLASVEGELASLVQAEADRRAAEEAKKVQAQLAAKAAAKAAADAEAKAKAEAVARESSRSSSQRSPTTTTTLPKPTATAGDEPSTSSGGGSPAAGASAAIAEARRQLGKPYQWGGSGPDSFDCSGLTSWAWRAGGKSLSHSSRAQYSETSRVSIADLQPGDLVFYGSPIHHVGLYIGDGQMIDAPETGRNVRQASIYRSDLVGAGRVN